AQLFRLTNDRRFLDQLQLTFFNHLQGAQRVLDGKWCYFTPLEGVKHPTADLTCCASSGPRGVRFASTVAITRRGNRIQFNIPGMDSGEVHPDGEHNEVWLTASKYPFPGNCTLDVNPKHPVELELAVYLPEGAALRRMDDGTPLPSDLSI